MLTTVASPARLKGHGLHSGRPAAIAVLPSAPGSGITFTRIDLPGRPTVRASWDRTGPLVLCTTLCSGDRMHVSTIEHLMAALAASGIDDADVAVDGPELPIADGSAAPFMQALALAGKQVSATPGRSIKVLKKVSYQEGHRSVTFHPAETFSVECGINFAHPAIGRSTVHVALGESFRSKVAAARTFALLSDVESMRAAGLALGGSLDNAIVVGGEGVLNPGGLRMPDEFARHKALDAVGDLYLAGAPIIGRYVGVQAGHAINNAALRKLMADSTAWAWTAPARQYHLRAA